MTSSAPERIRTSDQLPLVHRLSPRSAVAAATYETVMPFGGARKAPETGRDGATKVQPSAPCSDATSADLTAYRNARAMRPLPRPFYGGLAA